jgi:hypothetical protein
LHTWGEILKELSRTQNPQGTGPDFDVVRRKYLAELSHLTGRATILYASSYLEPRPAAPLSLQINLADMQGFMETVSNIKEKNLDLILHSPGGQAEAAESIVDYLRCRFDHVRVFVPMAAMSAATMIALSANDIVMGQHSQLGPIDPQFTIATPEGPRSAPAMAILEQFELAKAQCKDPSNLAAWMPILRTYAPGLLTQCVASQKLAVEMVSRWLKKYMFAGEDGADEKASRIASWFADYDSFQSHGRRVGPDQALEQGVKVTRLESNQELQDAALAVHHAMMHTFSGTFASKIIENHLGRAWVIMPSQIQISNVQQQPPSLPNQPNHMTRQQRRALERKGRLTNLLFGPKL